MEPTIFDEYEGCNRRPGTTAACYALVGSYRIASASRMACDPRNLLSLGESDAGLPQAPTIASGKFFARCEDSTQFTT
jgi:hypothetical protein